MIDQRDANTCEVGNALAKIFPPHGGGGRKKYFLGQKKVCTLRKLSWCSLTSIGKLVLKDLTSSMNIFKYLVLEKEA